MKLTQTIENTIYGYNPQEFLPVFRDGELDNRAAFLVYKIARVRQHVGQFIERLVEAGQQAQA